MNKTNLKLLVALLMLISINAVAKQNNAKIEVLYFHATIRCEGCLSIEEKIKNTIDNYYPKEVKSGVLNLKSLDFLKPENQHFQDDYNFDAQTLIIRKVVNGKVVRWKNLDKIWDYNNDYNKFSKYVKKEIDKLIKES